MPSPFPGMDPYLEGPAWPDFHATFIVCLRSAIAKRLPSHYLATIDERINLVEVDRPSERTLFRPDVSIDRPLVSESAGGGATAVLTTIEPVILPLPKYEEQRETRIEILDRPENTLIAVIEVLSPSNKTAATGQGEYRAKRSQILRQNVHLIELDFLFGGSRLPMGLPLPPGDYYALVSRADRRPQAEVYAWKLPDPLPTIPIPLLPSDPDISVNLQDVFTTAFDMGGYLARLRYSAPPSGFIPETERVWVAHIAKSTGC